MSVAPFNPLDKETFAYRVSVPAEFIPGTKVKLRVRHREYVLRDGRIAFVFDSRDRMNLSMNARGKARLDEQIKDGNAVLVIFVRIAPPDTPYTRVGDKAVKNKGRAEAYIVPVSDYILFRDDNGYFVKYGDDGGYYLLSPEFIGRYASVPWPYVDRYRESPSLVAVNLRTDKVA